MLGVLIASLQRRHSFFPMFIGFRVGRLVGTLRQAIGEQFAVGCGQEIKALRRSRKSGDSLNTRGYSRRPSENGVSLFCAYALGHRQGCEAQDQYCHCRYSDYSAQESPILVLHEIFSFPLGGTLVRPRRHPHYELGPSHGFLSGQTFEGISSWTFRSKF